MKQVQTKKGLEKTCIRRSREKVITKEDAIAILEG